MADFSLLIMANRQRSNAIIRPPIILNIMSTVFVEESFELLLEVPFAEATVGGFAPDDPEDGGGLELFPSVALKKGYISYRTVQLPNND
jgi:hypothetical protein